MSAIFDGLRFFKPHEFVSPGRMDPGLLQLLDRARGYSDVPFIITSSVRPGILSAHNAGKAVDIRVKDSYQRFEIVSACIRVGFTRIGVYDRHVHVDVDSQRPSPVLWSGVSK